ncbi:5-(carboxyamino)imidazole ribonucleotide mutase [Peptostreptococcus canis]|uniref:N5-carboxyaminoimidazole ribonucleotide mutase n=1 Tax=Peptostreptococcus canis TaxID=1159213 RepID=A0ABR6TLC6_9FIRM|nr:5-(carboxyamino)imidazole ribonucleotide mutase [Peptostreptococcus canis]MBC2576216.1 5-(carboxyamino)imidazole ribonucleotide mutase [Peptostreptococcus canis]MBP1998249.1 5-(carboxyamino)imidazole ribonucleotide mutase [Peptostreptococcus canis]
MKIAVIMGSKSDYPKLESGIDLLKKFGVDVVVRVLSAHRTPIELTEFLEEIKNDTDVIIAAAGKAAHLPGVVAAQSLIPVVGLPIKSSTMDGLDSLLSMVQMPSGIPVATVTIDSSINAALMAMQMGSIKFPEFKEKIADYRREMADKVLEDDASLR